MVFGGWEEWSGVAPPQEFPLDFRVFSESADLRMTSFNPVADREARAESTIKCRFSGLPDFSDPRFKPDLVKCKSTETTGAWHRLQVGPSSQGCGGGTLERGGI